MLSIIISLAMAGSLLGMLAWAVVGSIRADIALKRTLRVAPMKPWRPIDETPRCTPRVTDHH